ncbi:hypothetical protein KCMC57_up01740 [Kitasatospora sp. CMC57]|uniref:Uncharacterized protein n=1 Tax=Kitasatospora sp. CMC57 TaxID=3231513 RepID=A0AB33JR79_9ACTN
MTATACWAANAYSPPGPARPDSSQVFAPSIGVPEDIANANSMACLAARTAGSGADRLTVDMGDHLGRPSTVTAAVHHDGLERRIRVGGRAAIVRTLVR